MHRVVPIENLAFSPSRFGRTRLPLARSRSRLLVGIFRNQVHSIRRLAGLVVGMLRIHRVIPVENLALSA